jgi:hypothetical protein
VIARQKDNEFNVFFTVEGKAFYFNPESSKPTYIGIAQKLSEDLLKNAVLNYRQAKTEDVNGADALKDLMSLLDLEKTEKRSEKK